MVSLQQLHHGFLFPLSCFCWSPPPPKKRVYVSDQKNALLVGNCKTAHGRNGAYFGDTVRWRVCIACLGAVCGDQFSTDLTCMSVTWNSRLGVWCSCTKLWEFTLPCGHYFSPQCLSVCLTICTCEYPFDTEVLPGSLFSSAWPVHPNCLDYTGTFDRQISHI